MTLIELFKFHRPQIAYGVMELHIGQMGSIHTQVISKDNVDDRKTLDFIIGAYDADVQPMFIHTKGDDNTTAFVDKAIINVVM